MNQSELPICAPVLLRQTIYGVDLTWCWLELRDTLRRKRSDANRRKALLTLFFTHSEFIRHIPTMHPVALVTYLRARTKLILLTRRIRSRTIRRILETLTLPDIAQIIVNYLFQSRLE